MICAIYCTDCKETNRFEDDVMMGSVANDNEKLILLILMTRNVVVLANIEDCAKFNMTV